MEININSNESVCEEMLELERKYYEDLRNEALRQELDLQDQEDAYLARAVFEHMEVKERCISTDAKGWCLLCEQGQILQNHLNFQCTSCKYIWDISTENGKQNIFSVFEQWKI